MNMEEGTEIEHADPRDEIARLEARIEELAAEIENCGKFILAGWVTIVSGGLLFLLSPVLAFTELGRYLSIILAAAIVAVIGGIVVAGSNRSTAREASTKLEYAKSRRSALIGQIDLRVVS
jgi:hypothetical protein